MQGILISRFDFVHDYWTAFLNGFQFLRNDDEVAVAIDSITMSQVSYGVFKIRSIIAVRVKESS